MAKRTSTLTRFLEDIVDDTKDLVDDILDRASDLEEDMMGVVSDAVEDDEMTGVSASNSDIAALHAALADLTVKVNRLAELQLAGAKA